MGLVSKYVNEVRNQTAMTAVYPPNTALQLGAVGSIIDDIFIPEGNIEAFSIPFETSGPGPILRREFKSSSVIKTTFAAGASVNVANVANVKARLELEFGSEFGVFVAVTGCRQQQIKDINAVRAAVMELRTAGKWNDGWRIVTSLTTAKNLTIIVARQRNSKIVLEAEGNVPQIDLANVELKLNVVVDSTSSEQWITETADDKQLFTPFCGLHGIRWNWPKAKFDFLASLEAVGSGAAPALEQEFGEIAGPIDHPWEGWLPLKK
jgi:hypothetical protein